MPFRKKALYYGLMLLLTLLALEGMARIAYYAAYGQGYGGGPAAANSLPAPDLSAAPAMPLRINHPFYGYTWPLPQSDLNAMPPRQRREDTVVIGLLGGSVAAEVQPFLERALRRQFAANNLPRQPLLLGWSLRAAKQPQPAIIAANTLLLGGEFDLLVNLDGFNDGALGPEHSLAERVFPFFPFQWQYQDPLTTEGRLRAGQIGVLRQEQARLRAAAATSPLRRSALFGLANRWRRERIAAEIIQWNRQLAAMAADYSLEQHGPRTWRPGKAELLPAAARVWYRSSAMLARLAELAGAEYYHFLQPSQYVPDSKPLSAAELKRAYTPQGDYGAFAGPGYRLLQSFGRDLPSQGVNYFDLTGIFVDRPETLYKDECCHLNARGYELLAAEMARRLEPALRRLGRENPPRPVSPLAAARRPAEPDLLLVSGDFQVYRREDRWLRYARPDCVPADTEPRFFLHLTPRDLSDLPSHRRGHGFANLDFSFAEAGGRRWRGQCLLEMRLPDYPLAHIRTGQYAPEDGELWAGGYAFPPPRN